MKRSRSNSRFQHLETFSGEGKYASHEMRIDVGALDEFGNEVTNDECQGIQVRLSSREIGIMK
jgi:hypothetical protein